MPPNALHGRAKQGFGMTSLDATAAVGHQQRSAPQTLPSVARPAPSYLYPQAGEEMLGAPQVSPVATPYTDMQQSRVWWGGDNTNDGTIFRDRHILAQHGTEVAGRLSNNHDPLLDGPPRPDFKMVNRTWNWQVGTGQRYTDDLTRPYTWVGEQDGSGYTRVYGGQPGFFRWGPGGVPSTADDPGPGRVPTGPPHGLHSLFPPDGQQTLARFRNVPAMVPPRVDRLSNSRVAGQNYSERTLRQGEARTAFRGRG